MRRLPSEPIIMILMILVIIVLPLSNQYFWNKAFSNSTANNLCNNNDNSNNNDDEYDYLFSGFVRCSLATLNNAYINPSHCSYSWPRESIAA